MPPKNKARSAPNQHDKRHESGLAQPGKRVSKKQSNGHLNGLLDGKPVSPAQPHVHPSSSSSNPTTAHAFAYSSDTHDAITHPNTPSRAECPDRDRTYSDASMEETGPCGEMHLHYEHAALSPSAEAHQPVYHAKTPTHAGGVPSSVSTILSYYPLRDAISILILLLSLPPTLVLVIQTLFASLTFVPPTTSISLSTVPNIKEFFNSPNLGYPALATILIVDLIFWVCWLPVWKPIQGIFLDLSQAVIAVSLSGAASQTSGPTYSVATTTVIVCIVHVLRYRAIHLTALDYLRSVLHKVDIGIQIDAPSFAATYASSPPVDRGWIYTVIRTILGIHIVSQGVTTAIRHSLVKANEQSANVPAITKTETDPNSSSDAHGRHGPSTAEGPSHTSAATGTDVRPTGSPARRDSKPRESTAKKKKKQVDRIRGNQPLWAAIASTKVTWVKNQEQKDAVDDAREAARVPSDTANTIASNFITSTAKAWIRNVRDKDIFFSVQLPYDATVRGVNDVEEGTSIGAGIDKTKPFYVRINGATWSSTRIRLIPSDDSSYRSADEHYDGEIFGLEPMSSYQCEIVSINSQKVLCEMSIITQPAPTPEQAATTSAPTAHQALRPSSPITTLKQAVATAEAKLAEARNRSKKGKKDQRAGTSDIKREISSLKSKLDSSGGTDDKQERRSLQIRQHKSQAEDATAAVQSKIDALGEIPAEESAASKATHNEWQSASDAKKSASKDQESRQAEAGREHSALESEFSQGKAKKEKLVARNAQRKQELEKLISRQEAEMTAKQRRDFERAQTVQQHADEEASIFSLIHNFETEVAAMAHKTQDSYQQLTALQQWSSSQLPPSYSSPPTPETALAVHANGSLHSPQTNGFPPFNPNQPLPHHFSSPYHSANTSLSNPPNSAQPMPPPPHQPRGRSSSMLSQFSSFTDNGDEYSFAPESQPAPPRMQYSWPNSAGIAAHWQVGAGAMDDRKESEGSGSASVNNGSTGSNSPRPDARPFVPGSGSNGSGGVPKAVGTIGPPGGRKGGVGQSPVAAAAVHSGNGNGGSGTGGR